MYSHRGATLFAHARYSGNAVYKILSACRETLAAVLQNCLLVYVYASEANAPQKADEISHIALLPYLA